MTLEDTIRAQLVAALQSPEGKAAIRAALAEALPAMPADNDEQMVGVSNAALRLGISRSTVYKLAEDCKLPSVKIGTRLLFKVGDIKAYREKNRRSPALVAKLASGRS